MKNQNFNPKINHRKTIRLQNYDYSQEGYYFITICTENKKCILGKIENKKMVLNQFGKKVKDCWLKIEKTNNFLKLDQFVIMPNHIHGILIIDKNVGVPLVGTQDSDGLSEQRKNKNSTQGRPQGIAPTKTIGEIIGGFKSLTTNEYIKNVKAGKFPSFKKRIWQRNYYEHIIRNEESLDKIWEYIVSNPETWEKDDLFVG